jgi:hypothetical protein
MQNTVATFGEKSTMFVKNSPHCLGAAKKGGEKPLTGFSPVLCCKKYEVFVRRLGPEGLSYRGLFQQLGQAGGADRRRVDFADILANLVTCSRLGPLVFAAPGTIPQQVNSFRESDIY